MRKKIKKSIAGLIAFATLLAFSASALDDTVLQSSAKEEVIYANLDTSGKLEKIYVVNSFDLSAAGEIVDYGNYSELKNLSSENKIEKADDKITASAGAGRFFYQGELAGASLPWDISVDYYLNDVKASAEEIAGKSGKAEIKINIMKNAAAAGDFFENYAMQASLKLDLEKFKNIAADGATEASAGKFKQLNYTVLPGNEKSFSITADVEGFEIEGITFAGISLNFGIEMPDTDDIIGDLGKLGDGIASIDSGAGSLASGVSELKTGLDKLKTGAAALETGLDALSSQSDVLASGSSQFKNGLSQINSALQNITMTTDSLDALVNGSAEIKTGISQLADSFSGINQLVAALKANEAVMAAAGQTVAALEAGLGQMEGGASLLKKNYAAFDAGIAQIPGMLSGMAESLTQLKSGINALNSSYSELDGGIAGYIAGVKEIAKGYFSLYDGIAAAASGAGELKSGADKFKDGTGELASKTGGMEDEFEEQIDKFKGILPDKDYKPASFVSPKNTEIKSVQFVIKTAEIKMPEAAKEEPAPEPKETFWQKFLNLFR